MSSHAFHENHSDKDKEKEILVSCYSLTFILFPSRLNRVSQPFSMCHMKRLTFLGLVKDEINESR